MNPQAVDNLLALYERNEDRTADAEWYLVAQRAMKARARRHGLPWRRYAAIVAATSPMMQWEGNLDAADRMVSYLRGERETPGALGQKHARRIIDGEPPMNVLGPKTRAFYRNLTGRLDDVTLDRWALRAIGWPRETVTESEVPIAAAPYYAAAEQLGITPSALQAATWTQIRREATA